MALLRAGGLSVQVLRTTPAFGELRISDASEACIVDLVAVDNRHELLASKLAALLERSEIRDLVDVKALLDAGGQLKPALGDAPKKDAGFSPLTLAWVLNGYDLLPGARFLGWSAARTEELVSFQRWLIEQLTAGSAPE